jgi:hypothetical protein
MGGIIKKSIQAEITDAGFDYDQLDELTCYYGNIDIRHHLGREADPVQATKNLLKSYTEVLKTCDGKKLEVVCALPIEDEARKLPATGLYKGTPFFGSRALRQELVKVFNDQLQEHAAKNGWDVFKWPASWYELDGLEFFEYMEAPRSVHLARKYYRWNLAADCHNELLGVAPAQKLFTF